jgi:hypothetical protein
MFLGKPPPRENIDMFAQGGMLIRFESNRTVVVGAARCPG